HKGVQISLIPVSLLKDSAKDILAKDPDAMTAVIAVDVQLPDLKGGGIDGRVTFRAGSLDPSDLLRFANTRENAPGVHFGGRFQITVDANLKMRIGRSADFYTVVGCPGIGKGTFAFISYDNTIPDGLKPIVEITYPPTKPGGPPVKEKYELEERC